MGLRSNDTRQEPQTPDKPTMTTKPPDQDPAAASPKLLGPGLVNATILHQIVGIC